MDFVTLAQMLDLPETIIKNIQREWIPTVGEPVHVYDDFLENSGIYEVMEVSPVAFRINAEPLYTWMNLKYYRESTTPLLSVEEYENYRVTSVI